MIDQSLDTPRTQDLDVLEHQAIRVTVAGVGHLHGQHSLQGDGTTHATHQAVYPEREACVIAVVFRLTVKISYSLQSDNSSC